MGVGKMIPAGPAPCPMSEATLARFMAARQRREAARNSPNGDRPRRRRQPEWYDLEALRCVRCLKPIRVGDRWAVSGGGYDRAHGYGRRYYHERCWPVVA